MGITSDTLVMDVAVHVGTLGAVTLYLWRDVARIAKGLIQACLGRRNDGARLGFHVALATIPVVIAGYFGHSLIENTLRALQIVARTTPGLGVLLSAQDRYGLDVSRIGLHSAPQPPVHMPQPCGVAHPAEPA